MKISKSGTFGIGGANKIHSSRGHGINKILGDIEKNMSESSPKKKYKH